MTSEISHSASNFSADPATERVHRYRGWFFVGLALIMVVGLGVWGLTAFRGSDPVLGSEFGHDGGTAAVVDAFTIDDPMVSMMGGSDEENAEAFAQQGMNMAPMAQMIADAVPEGMKRVAIQLELAAGDSVMRIPESDISLDVDGTRYVPYSSLLSDGELQPGDHLRGAVTFEVPIEASISEFRLRSDMTPVTVDVSRGPGGSEPMIHDEHTP